jgi:hypothetical protein
MAPPDGFSHHELMLVLSGSPWPFDPLLHRRTISHMDVASNVVGGVGFVGGVLIRTIPFETCLPGCELVYSTQSARLTGRIFDSTCGNRPLDKVTIELREVSGSRTRRVVTDRHGHFRIDAIDAELVHELWVLPVYGFQLRPTQPLGFSAGGEAAMEVAMVREPWNPC